MRTAFVAVVFLMACVISDAAEKNKNKGKLIQSLSSLG